jgi:hypothetical protein
MGPRIKIEVTERHLIHGIPQDPKACAIALTLADADQYL